MCINVFILSGYYIKVNYIAVLHICNEHTQIVYALVHRKFSKVILKGYKQFILKRNLKHLHIYIEINR